MSDQQSDTNKEKISARAPEQYTGLKTGAPKQVAAGPKAVLSSLQHITHEMNLFRGLKVLNKLNQMDGYDCPGCAWPDPDDKRSLLGEYCENGAKAVAEEATTKKADPAFFEKNSVASLSHLSDYDLGKSGRITHPMVLEEGASHYKPIGWEDAFKMIAEELNSLDSPDEAIFYTSGRTSNEAAFLYQLFVRQYGTNNLPDCSNMCHESSGVALSETLGIGKGSVTLEDFYETDLVIVMGQNPGTNHPRMLSALQKTKQNGGKIITVNPLPETGLIRFKHPQHPADWMSGGTELTDLFLQVKINGDVALLKGIMKIMLDKEEKNPGSVFDKKFIGEKTSGYEQFIEKLRRVDLEKAAEDSGVPLGQIKEAAQMVIDNKNIIVCWAMGLTQHKNGVYNIKEIVNLLLLRGSIGKKGAGTCPVRGHSNVQGDRTMGIWEKPEKAFLDRLKEEFNFDPPMEHGYDTVHAIEAMAEGKARVFFAMGGNFLSATPDTEYTAKALQNCSLTVQVSTKPNRSHLIHGKKALILPCLGRTEIDRQKEGEQFVSVENSMGVVHSSEGNLEPASEHLLSEPAIVAALAKAVLGEKNNVDWTGMAANYDNIRNAIEKCIPGFDNYNERVRKKGGFYLPNNAREADFKAIGNARFSLIDLPEHDIRENEYFMMTIRSHDQYNTTIYGLDDRYRGIYNERRVVLMNKEDMKKEGIEKGERVNLTSRFEGEERKVYGFLALPYNIPKQCTATYFPEANPLVSVKQKADKSHTPVSKSVVIRVEKT